MNESPKRYQQSGGAGWPYTRRCPRQWALACMVLGAWGLVTLQHDAGASRTVFNDDRPETHALEIWRITHDPAICHHSVYHNANPFSYDGRYALYVIKDNRNVEPKERFPSTFAVYDLMLDREIWRCPGPARWPVWAHRSHRIFWADGRKGRRQNVWQVSIPDGDVIRICDDALNAVTGVSPDDQWLFYTYNKVFGVRTRPGASSEVVWAHPEAPKVSSSLVCHNPTKPVFQVRQNPSMLRHRQHRWSKKYPARMLVTDDGQMLGPALASIEQSHGAWRGDGEYLIAGDGLLRGRLWNQPYPAPLLAYSNSSAHDPSPCGYSGQWTCTTDGINDTLKVFDWRTTDTKIICYASSIIHQTAGDAGDRSGAYDSDAHGSPDGTKIYFSTNYQIDHFPVTRITHELPGNAVEVLSTEGFPDAGLLSIHVGIVAYSGRTQTSFTGLRKGALGSRIGPTPRGFTVSNLYGRTDPDGDDLLSAQYETDVYLAVVRLPDRPTLVATENHMVLYPGHNHREIRGYHLSVDGKQMTEMPWPGRPAVSLPAGEHLRARAVEWSGLMSEWTEPEAMTQDPRPLRFEPEMPESFQGPVRKLFALDHAGRRASPPPGKTLQTLPDAVGVWMDADGTVLTEKTYRNGILAQKTELTADGRKTLVIDYAPDGDRTRTIRDAENRILRIEYLDREGFLTKTEDFSRGRRVRVTEYHDGRPARRVTVARDTTHISVNRDGFWEKAPDLPNP